MNIKIMLNKDEEIKKLAKDPKVQVKIKAAIIDGIGTRAIKSVEKELAPAINEAVRREVYGHGFSLKDQVNQSIEKRAKQAVDDVISMKIANIMEKEFYSIVRKQVEEYVEAIKRMDIKSIVEKNVAKILERKLNG